jgi:hypothetical protein
LFVRGNCFPIIVNQRTVWVCDKCYVVVSFGPTGKVAGANVKVAQSVTMVQRKFLREKQSIKENKRGIFGEIVASKKSSMGRGKIEHIIFYAHNTYTINK